MSNQTRTTKITMGWGLILVLGVTACLTLVSAGWAAEPTSQPVEQDDETLDDIDLLDLQVETVVTGMRKKQDVKDMPYAVSVITGEDIREGGFWNVPDALRLAAGVDVGSVLYGWTTVAPRGFFGARADQNLVLIDGRHMYEPVLGGTAWSSWPLMVEDIERIEVIRGSGGVTWGSGATNGVINVVTKDPADQQGATSSNRAGSRGTNQEYLGYAFTEGKLRLRVSGEHESTDGYLEGPGLLNTLMQRVDNEYRSGHFSMKGIYDYGPRDTITFGAGSNVVDGFYSPNPFMRMRTNNPNTQANYVSANWRHNIAKDNSFNLTGYFQDFYHDMGMETFNYRYDQFGLDFNHSFKPSDNHTLTWGIDSRADYADSSYSHPGFMRDKYVGTGTIGAYVQDEWKFAPRWALELGARMDYEFYGGFQPSSRASLSYKLTEDSLVYGAVSRSFLMPPAPGRFVDVSIMNGGSRMVVDPDLDPTGMLGYELGYRKTFFKKLDTSYALYWHEYSQVFGTSQLLHMPPTPNMMNVKNIGDASMYGFESEAKYPITKKLTLVGNYTYQALDWRTSVPKFTAAMDLNTPPKHKFMVGPRYKMTDRLTLSGQVFFVDDVKAPLPIFPLLQKHIPSYFRVDLRAEYELIKQRAWLAVGVQNLLDPAHFEATSSFETEAQVPRMVYGELRMTFK